MFSKLSIAGIIYDVIVLNYDAFNLTSFIFVFSSFVAYNIEINLKYHHFVNNPGNMRSLYGPIKVIYQICCEYIICEQFIERAIAYFCL